MYNFQKLKVWQKSTRLAKNLHELSTLLPQIERYNLSDQLRRAATSVPLNIAEGSGGRSSKIFRRHLLISRNSILEIVAILHLIETMYSIKTTKYLQKCDEVSRMLSGLINSVS